MKIFEVRYRDTMVLLSEWSQILFFRGLLRGLNVHWETLKCLQYVNYISTKSKLIFSTQDESIIIRGTHVKQAYLPGAEI